MRSEWRHARARAAAAASRQVDAEIRQKNFFALRVYALLWARTRRASASAGASAGASADASAADADVAALRLIYLGGDGGAAERVSTLAQSVVRVDAKARCDAENAATAGGSAGGGGGDAENVAASDAVLRQTEAELRAIWREVRAASPLPPLAPHLVAASLPCTPFRLVVCIGE